MNQYPSAVQTRLNRIDGLQKEIEALKPISSEQESRIFQKFRLDWDYQSSAIEGNSLNYGEAVAFIMEGLTAKGKPLKDHLDIQGHNEAINFLLEILKEGGELTERDIRELHQLIMGEPYQMNTQTADGQPTIRTIQVGVYKLSTNHVQRASGEIHYYATPEETPVLMQELMDWYRENRKKMHPLVLSATFHHKFSSIHPFDDGNGRLARLLSNLILMQAGMPPVIVRHDQRREYFNVLSQADAGVIDPLIEYFADILIHSLELYLRGARGETITEVDERPSAQPIADEATENEESSNIQYAIASYGADFDVDGLVRRINRHDIIIPSFQRAYVWNAVEASRFIESLLLGLPVPGVFLSKDNDSNQLLVVDGQQRLKTLQFFVNGYFNPKEDDKKRQVFKLQKVQNRFLDKTYSELDEDDRRQLDNSIIHATIIKQESPNEDNTSVFHIFERLNTGGQKLSAQEIRTAVCYGKEGKFIKAIDELNDNAEWRAIFGKPNVRLKDKELILRYLALTAEFESYQRPMGEFLNKFMKAHSNPTDKFLTQAKDSFTKSIKCIYEALDSKAFKPQRAINAANFDAVMVGVTKNIDNVVAMTSARLSAIYNILTTSEDFIRYTEKATADEASVKGRINLAIEAFAQK
jgi:Fic family protein